MFVKSIVDEKGPDVITVSPADPIRQVAKMFKRERIGFALVTNGMEAFLGTVSERDIIHALAERGDLGGLPVVDIMTTNVVTCNINDTLDTVRHIMTQQRTRHVLTMNGGELAGVVSIGDLIKHSLDECQIDTEQMRDYISGHGYQ